MAILARLVERGFRVGMLCQPDWQSAEPWCTFGPPVLFFAVSAGNMDSMINHYTANRKVRNDDAYSPGGRIGLRPDRATLPYRQRAREAYPGVPVIAGGVEASLRRLAHYDYWSDTVRGSIVLDAKADLVVYGMGERNILEIARRLAAGGAPREVRELRGVTYALGASEALPDGPKRSDHPQLGRGAHRQASLQRSDPQDPSRNEPPQRALHPAVAWRPCGDTEPSRSPPHPGGDGPHRHLPYTRRPHPSYQEKIPAYEMVKDSVTIMRGCFGGCTFCSITAHQGRTIQSRSQASVLRELERMAEDPAFKGVVSDIGGPTANMYEMRCTKPEVEAICRRLSCAHPRFVRAARHRPWPPPRADAPGAPCTRGPQAGGEWHPHGLARRSPTYMDELAAHHVGGHLKVAPEHVDARVLEKMKKPANIDFEGFAEGVPARLASGGKPKQGTWCPTSSPATRARDLKAMIELALFLKRNGLPAGPGAGLHPGAEDVATSMYYTGLDPRTLEPVTVAKKMRDRRFQRALLQVLQAGELLRSAPGTPRRRARRPHW